MGKGRFLICERSGRWAAALRRAAHDTDPRGREIRSLDDCWRELTASPTSLVAVEVTIANVERVVRWIRRVESAFPRAHVVAVGERELEPTQWLLRDAGARHAVFSPRQLASLARMARRYLTGNAAGEEDSPWPWAGARLPWSENKAVEDDFEQREHKRHGGTTDHPGRC